MRKRKSRLSREFLPILGGLLFSVRASHLAESESRSAMQRHTGPRRAGLSLHVSCASSSAFLPFHLREYHHHCHHRCPPPPPPPSSSSSTRQGPSTFAAVGGFLGPLTPPRRPLERRRAEDNYPTSPHLCLRPASSHHRPSRTSTAASSSYVVEKRSALPTLLSSSQVQSAGIYTHARTHTEAYTAGASDSP